MTIRNFVIGGLAGAALMLAGCGATPHHAEVRVDRASTLFFANGPKGAIVFIDGREAATIRQSKTVVRIPDGTHEVRVEQGGRIVYARTIFIEDGTQKRISIENR